MLVDNYIAVEHLRGKLWLLVRYCDLDQALTQLKSTHPEEHSIIAQTMQGLSLRKVAETLEMPPTSTWRGYWQGIRALTGTMNGDTLVTG